MTAAERLAAFATGLRLSAVPDDVVTIAKQHLLDTIGVGLAGRALPGPTAVRGLVAETGRPGRSTVWGETGRMAAAFAAMSNGAASHALDFDDGHATSVLHPSASLVPALFAQAEESGASGEEFLVSLVAAYELILRLGLAQYDEDLRNSVFFEQGLHATSILGAVAAAPLVARLRGLPGESSVDALAVACSFGAGIIEANRAGGTVKQVHCGWAAHAAVSSAALVAHGLTGPRTVLEGRFGLFTALCGDRWSSSALVEGLGSTWLIRELGIKPYPCNMFTHSLIDAATLLREAGVRPDDIERVDLGIAEAPARTVGQPLEEKHHPQSPYHAAFSGPYVFASAFLGGTGLAVGLEDFTDGALGQPQRIALAEKCRVVADPACTAAFPRHMGAVVTAHLRGGGQRVERVEDPRGSWRRPLTPAELESKLRATAGQRAKPLLAAVEQLESAADLAAIAGACA